MSMTCLALAAATSLAVLSPQSSGNAQGPDPILSASEHRNLRTKLRKWLVAEERYQIASEKGGRERQKASKKRLDAKDDFRDEWKSKMKKGNLLASMADLRAIYDNCFDVGKPPKSPGVLRPGKPVEWKGTQYRYSYFLPKKYKPANPVPTVLMLPGSAGDAKWTDAKRWFEETWLKTQALEDTAFHIPQLIDGLEMDPVPDFSREGQEATEQQRIDAIWVGFGQTIRQVNVDRPHVYVDCGRGDSAFGVRFVSMFPDRFAGIILRSPTELGDIRLGSLLGIPVLMIRNDENGDVVDSLKEKFEAVTPDSVTVIEATDAYPYKASAGAIHEWMGKQRRDMMRKHVIIEPNHNLFKNAYWVRILTMNPIHTSTAANKPRIEVTADRETNRIVVKAQGIEDFALLLNDALLDLDKEFTVVVNDVATTEKKTRNERNLIKELRLRRDWEYLFPVIYRSSVPKKK